MKLFKKFHLKKIQEDVITESLNKIRSVLMDTITTIQIDKVNYSFWPLFLSERSQRYSPSDIDTCATSLGTKALLELTENPRLPQITSILENASKTILFMRNPDGSWPSIIFLSTKKPPQMEGVLNDTTYALECLINLGFLNNVPEIPINYDLDGRNLNSLDNRIDLVMESIKWLLDNRVGNGWNYIGRENLDPSEVSSPAILPTSNVVIILNSVIKSLDELRKTHPILDDAKIAYNEVIAWLKDIQTEGAFGKKKGDKPTIVHTAIAINALLTDEENNKKEILKGIKWILKNKRILSLKKLENEEIFDEYDQIIFINKKTLRRRIIKHENFLEGILLYVLLNTDEKGLIKKLSFYHKYKFRKIIKYLLYELLNLQVKSGSLEGAFRSRRSAPAEKHPIYTLYFAILGLKSLRKNLKSILKKPSLGTMILIFTGLLIFFALMSLGISWAFSLTLEKAVGVFLVETAIAVAVSVVRQRII